MVIRDDLTEALLQENLALKEKVKSLMKMLKKDRLRNKDLEAKLEAKIYESSVDREIEKELNNTLEKGSPSTKRSAQLEVKKESLAEEEEEVLIVDIDDEEEEAGQGVGEEESEETFFLKGEPSSEEHRNPEETLVNDVPLGELDVTASLEETVETKPRLLGELLQSFVQEMRPGPSQEIETEMADDLTLENGANSKVANADDISSIETSPVDEKSIVERNIVIETRISNSFSTDEGNETTLEKNSDGRYQCNMCSVKHISKEYVRNHIKGKHEGYRWKCDECAMELDSPYKMKSHKDIHHMTKPGTSVSKVVKAQKSELPLEKNSDGRYQCNICDFKHRDKLCVRNHIKGKHEGYRWKCDECGKELTSPQILKRHKENRHMTKPGTSVAKVVKAKKTEAPLERNSDGRYLCNICDFKHQARSCVRNHIKGKHEGYRWKCDECGKELTSPQIMKRHKATRHMTKPGTSVSKVEKAKKGNLMGQTKTDVPRAALKGPVDCKVCGKSISHGNLKRHMLNAHGTDCVKTNGTEGILEGGSETIEKDFMSPDDAREVLNQIGNFNEGLDNRITYPIEKNTDGKFHCNICSRSHPSKEVIKNHILGMHAGYKWSCNKCEKELSSPTKLESHKIKFHADATEDGSISMKRKHA